MRIDRETPICGVRPVQLKALMRHDRFDTPKAMHLLGLAEPRVSETLRDLAAAGWLSWDGDHKDIDWWSSTPLGHRLAASRLISRFPIAQGRALLPKVINTARALNANPSASHRVAEILLFGSILTGKEDDDAGDIDLVVHISRRRLPKAELDALIEAEERRMPQHLDFYSRLSRQADDLRRAIKKVSNKISLHGFSDIETYSAPHRQIYRYDIETETDAEPDPDTRVVNSEYRPELERERKEPPSFERRAWPVAPNAPVILRPMDAEPLRVAQHLWMKGLDARAIGTRLRLPASAITCYLASRRNAQPSEPQRFDASLDWMIDSALEKPQSHAVLVDIVKRHDADQTIECAALDAETFEELADIRMFSGSDRWVSGRCDLHHVLEPVAEATLAWWERMRGQLVGLNFTTRLLRVPTYAAPASFGSRRPDLRPLVAPMRTLLARLLPKPLGQGAWDHRLELIRDRGRDKLFHVVGRQARAGTVSTLITRREEPRVWRQIKDVLESQADILQALGDFTLGVEARHIDGVSEAIRSSWAEED